MEYKEAIISISATAEKAIQKTVEKTKERILALIKEKPTINTR